MPWHVHSANAQVLFVNGTFQLTMKGQEARVKARGPTPMFRPITSTRKAALTAARTMSSAREPLMSIMLTHAGRRFGRKSRSQWLRSVYPRLNRGNNLRTAIA